MNMLSTQSEKAAAKSAKLDFDLHVALIQRSDKVNKNAALFKAWLEGPSGLSERLGPTAPAVSQGDSPSGSPAPSPEKGK